MEGFDPLYGLAAFFLTIALIFGLGWLLKNKTPLGKLASDRSVFAVLGTYRIDAKNKLCALKYENIKFIVLIGPNSACLVDKSYTDSSLPERKLSNGAEKSDFEKEVQRAINT